MPFAYKRLGAILSSGVIGTADTLYTVPADTSSVLSTIAVCNQAATSATFRLAISTTTSFVGTGYIVFGATIAPNDTIYLTCGFTMDATNKYLLTSASAATVNFTAYGSEIS